MGLMQLMINMFDLMNAFTQTCSLYSLIDSSDGYFKDKKEPETSYNPNLVVTELDSTMIFGPNLPRNLRWRGKNG